MSMLYQIQNIQIYFLSILNAVVILRLCVVDGAPLREGILVLFDISRSMYIAEINKDSSSDMLFGDLVEIQISIM